MTRFHSNAVAVSTLDHDAREAAESEQALLGSLMLDSASSWPQIRDVVNVTHLARADHRLIFSAISWLMCKGGPADGVLVRDRLRDAGELEAAGGVEYVAQLVQDTTSAANVAAYARIVREYADRHKVVDLAQQVAARARMGASSADLEEARRALSEQTVGVKSKPLETPAAALWADEDEPAPREWIWEPFIPAGRVTSLYGIGGLGKTMLALKLGVHASLGRALFDVPVRGGTVLGVFCEDETDELNRRVRAACKSEGVDLSAVDRLHVVSRDGEDSILCTFDHDHIQFTAFYWQLDATIEALHPSLVILDTAADLFAGDVISQSHVRQFLKVALGGYCKRHGCAVLLLAHPSKAGAASGEGDGGSVQWDAAVRSRMYLSKPKPAEGEPPESVSDRRVLAVKKTNYGAPDTQIPLVYEGGTFAMDREPMSAVAKGDARTKTARVALAALDFIRAKNPLVASFRELFESLQTQGILPPGSYDEHRKPLNRALRQLLSDGMIVETRTPRGYRLSSELR